VREQYFSFVFRSTGVTPSLAFASSNIKEGRLVYQRCVPFLEFAVDAAKKVGLEDQMLITLDQVKRMVDIVDTLSSFGVVHGDLQVSQFLKDTNSDNIYLTDFGIAFDKHVYRPVFADWTRVLGQECGEKMSWDQIMRTPALLRAVNLWFLEQALSEATILDDKGNYFSAITMPIAPSHRTKIEGVCKRMASGELLLGEAKEEEEEEEDEEEEDEYY
jgi:hypothetical protein